MFRLFFFLILNELKNHRSHFVWLDFTRLCLYYR